MRNLDALNQKLKQYKIPEHRKVVSDSHANLDWLKKHLHKSNTVDDETNRLLHMNQKDLHAPYE